MEISRRYFFFGALAIAASCRRAPRRSGVPRPVSVVRAGSYGQELEQLVRQILLEHRVDVRGQRVLLKPNLVEFDPNAPINTHPVFVAAVAAAFRAHGAASVRIGEGPGHRRTTWDMAEAAGFFSAIPKFESLFTDLNVDDVHKVVLRKPFSTLKELHLPQTVLDCDLLVSLAKLKTHHWAGATLSMKNLFGVVPGAVYGWPKNVLHWAGINECVADLHYLFPRQFALVDGIIGMEGNGPILGTPKHAGVIIAGAHAPSVDAAACQVIGIDPNKIGYLQLVARRSGWNPSDIKHVGESPGSVSQAFALLPEFEKFRLIA